MENKKLVILDGNSLINRAFYALPPMINSKNQPTGAVYGFTTMLLKILNDIKPDYIVAAFDRKAPTFRHIEYVEYKAGRKKMPEELVFQLQPVKDILKAFNVGLFELDSYEADDIIGTISKLYEKENLEIIIYTGDKDALQLVSDNTKVMITKKGITEVDVYDIAAIKEKYGFAPSGIIDLKGLMGDASDNIPGVPGVGEKTALKLLDEYITVEGVYENIDNIVAKKLKENLVQNKELAFLSKKLATIYREVPVEVDIETMKVEDYNSKEIINLFTQYEFKSLINRIKSNEKQEIEIPLEELVIYDGSQDITSDICKKGIFNFAFLFKDKEFKGMLIENNYIVEENNLFKFKILFEDSGILKNTYEAKGVYNYLHKQGIIINNLSFDAAIASYLLNPSESTYEIASILNRYGDITLSSNQSSEFAKVMGAFVNKLDQIKEKMLNGINEHNMGDLFYKIEMPLVEVLSSMEIQGFKVDSETLNKIGYELSEEIDRLTAQIHDLAMEEFNINSPKQLGVILFEKLQLPVIKKTKTGYSTDAEVLEELSSKHEIVDNILHYRQLVKLKSTYIDGLNNATGADGKIHSSFNQTITATGRISSTEPNMQNIPMKLEQGRRIRKAFIPENPDYIILSADYSQIELRLLAHISKDKNMVEAFLNNIDIHTKTASEVFGVPINEVTSLQRSRAKAVNFGIVYGLSDYGLSRDIKTTRKEAKQYIDNYFERYIGVKEYLEEAIKIGKENGLVTTLMNRIRFIPEINSTNRNVKMFGERLAMNTPIQGTAADIIKIAMVQVYKRLKDEKLKSKLLLQVHDELVLEVNKNELEYVKDLVKNEMENAMDLCVPLTVDVKWGENWYESK